MTLRQVPVVELPSLSSTKRKDIQNLLTNSAFPAPTKESANLKRRLGRGPKKSLSDE